MRTGHGSNGGKPLGQVCERLIVEVSAGDVDEFGSLLLDRRNDFGVAMAGGCHGDARSEVEELIAIHVFDADAAAAPGDQRIRAGVAWRDQAVIGLNSRASFRAGQWT